MVQDCHPKLKKIEVVAAVIVKDDGRIFATQRGYGEYKDKWEFPGGKIEAGETQQQALKREIKEELDTEITVDQFITTVEMNYEHFHLSMHCYFCHVLSGHLKLVEAENAKWLAKEHLNSVDWLPADRKVLKSVQKLAQP